MLRIAHITGTTSTKFGGFEQFMVSLSRQCAARGHRFFCVYEAPPVNSEVMIELARFGAQTAVIPATNRYGRFLWQISGWLRHHRIDIVHTWFNPAALLSGMAARLVGVPLSICSLPSGLSPEELAGLSWKTWLRLRLRLSLSSRVLAAAQTVAQQYRQVGLGGRHFHVYYLGIPPTAATVSRAEMREQLGLRADDEVILCVAFHHPIKGVDILVRAMRIIADRYPQARLVQVGGSNSPQETAALHSLSAELGLSDRIHWLGIRNDVRNIMECADIYCQPSRGEALAYTILEAMGAGLPVAGTRVGGIPEAITENVTGLLAEGQSPESLASALGRLLADRPLCRQMGDAGRHKVRKTFDLDKQNCRLLDIYESMWKTVST